jgi:hypothetical protein
MTGSDFYIFPTKENILVSVSLSAVQNILKKEDWLLLNELDTHYRCEFLGNKEISLKDVFLKSKEEFFYFE